MVYKGTGSAQCLRAKRERVIYRKRANREKDKGHRVKEKMPTGVNGYAIGIKTDVFWRAGGRRGERTERQTNRQTESDKPKDKNSCRQIHSDRQDRQIDRKILAA